MGTVLWMARRWNRDFAAPLGTSSVRRSLTCGVLLLVVSILGHVRSDREWTAVSGIELGPYRGDAVLRADPLLKGRAVYAVLELEGRRYDVWAFGPAGKRLSAHRFGEVLQVEGVRTPLPDGTARRRHLRHVVGRFEVGTVGSTEAGSLSRASPMVRAAHRVRILLARGARTLGVEVRALFAGLVYGDDSAQSPEMIERFRRSGLAHLTAVSGQNVAYVLAMASPFLTRLRRPVRWAATMGVLMWFVVLTRFEPSVLRAGLMAAVSASVFAMGRRATAWQVLGIAVMLGLVVDPFLLWSVGWWLSISGAA
ncbi:MAG: ComEC/Rec2 family competence protein, partial [Actinomycetota bacterium]